MSLREMLSDYWYAFQQELFPRLESELGPMGERYELFVAVLELVRVEALLPYFRGQVGRPEEDRAALARAFIAKAVFDVPTTRGLIERLEVDGRLWRLCGWSGAGRLPSEATFSRAFSEFAESRLASRLHETLIARTMDGHLVEHISRDATAIEAREKAAPKPKAAKPKRRKRGRPRKGEARAKEPSRLERQLTMSLPQMLADLPRACDVGSKRNAKGHTTSWIGYKQFFDRLGACGQVLSLFGLLVRPVGRRRWRDPHQLVHRLHDLLASDGFPRSTHDSQVAIPLGSPDGRGPSGRRSENPLSWISCPAWACRRSCAALERARAMRRSRAAPKALHRRCEGLQRHRSDWPDPRYRHEAHRLLLAGAGHKPRPAIIDVKPDPRAEAKRLMAGPCGAITPNCQMAPQRVDRLRPLAYQKIARTEQIPLACCSSVFTATKGRAVLPRASASAISFF